MNQQHINVKECPVLYALNIIGGKWRLPILWHLTEGGLRYNQLKRQLPGITNIMLTRSLQDLEKYGLIHRIQHAEVPPHVEYLLTKQAKNLIPALLAIQEWGQEQLLLKTD